MIIGFDASRAFLNNKTGTENYSYQLLTHLARIDSKNNYIVYLHPNSVIARNLDDSRMTKQSSTNEKDCHGRLRRPRNDKEKWPGNFEFITIPYPRLWTQFGLAQQTFKDKLDVLFVPSHTLPLIRKPGLKTIVTVHDLGAEFLPSTHQLKQRVYLKFMTDFQLKSTSHLIAVSQATKNDLVKKVHINPQKISVIYEGYDKSAFKPLKTDVLKDTLNYYEIERDNYFFFVGTIQPRKNLKRLIIAYASFLNSSFSNISQKVSSIKYLVSSKKQEILNTKYEIRNTRPKLVLAGNKGWLSDEIYELPKKLGIEDAVKFLGYVPDEKLPALYNGAIALLFPSLFEGFGLPILESMACGTPVLTSNISSMPEIAGKAALLVNPYSEEEIAQGITKLFSDQKLKNQLKKLGIAQAQKFSWEKCAEETLKVLETISN